MSSIQHKFRIRMLPNVDNFEEFLDMLDEMDVSYEERDGSIWDMDDEQWDVHYGIDTGNTYLDYIVGDDEGSLAFGDIIDVWAKIPHQYKPYMDNVRVVAYRYYGGTDEPEIF